MYVNPTDCWLLAKKESGATSLTLTRVYGSGYLGGTNYNSDPVWGQNKVTVECVDQEVLQFLAMYY